MPGTGECERIAERQAQARTDRRSNNTNNMNLKSYLLIIAASAALAGCSQSNEANSPAADKTVAGKDVKQDYKNALNDTRDYVGQSKDAFLGTIKSKMKDLDGKI